MTPYTAELLVLKKAIMPIFDDGEADAVFARTAWIEKFHLGKDIGGYCIEDNPIKLYQRSLANRFQNIPVKMRLVFRCQWFTS